MSYFFHTYHLVDGAGRSTITISLWPGWYPWFFILCWLHSSVWHWLSNLYQSYEMHFYVSFCNHHKFYSQLVQFLTLQNAKKVFLAILWKTKNVFWQTSVYHLHVKDGKMCWCATMNVNKSKQINLILHLWILQCFCDS